MSSSLPGNQDNYNVLLQNLGDLEKYIDDLKKFIPIPFCGVNINSIILEINNSFTELFGYSDYEMIGKKITILFDNPKQAEKIEKIIVDNKRIENQKFTMKKENGNLVDINFSAMPRVTENKEIIGYYASFNDITELNTMQQELERQVNELNRINNAMVGREMKMIELKKELNLLKGKK